MNKECLEFSLWLHFTFFLQNIRFPFTRSLELEGKLKDNNIEIHYSEFWEDKPSTRRFLWGYFPHLHFKKNLKEEEQEIMKIFNNLQITIDSNETELSISTVWGGASMAVLKLKGKLQKSQTIQFDWLNNLQDPQHDQSHEMNRFFMRQIIEYVRLLRSIEKLESGKNNKEDKIKWSEWYDERLQEEYIVAYSKKEGQYISGEQIFNIINGKIENEANVQNSKLEFFYQEPYIAIWVPRDKKVEERRVRENIFFNFFGENHPICEVYRKQKNIFADETKEEIQDKRHFEEQGIERGVGKLEIPHKFEIYLDPTRCLIFYKLDDAERYIREAEVHRALFVARTRMHFCILWEAKLQALSQKINDVLKKLPDMKSTKDLFDQLKKVNDLSLELSATSSELFNSFVWRYATFLPARMGYLSTIYSAIDSLLSTSVKTEDIRDYLNELRTQIEFTANFIREKIAEKLPQLIMEKSKSKNNRS